MDTHIHYIKFSVAFSSDEKAVQDKHFFGYLKSWMFPKVADVNMYICSSVRTADSGRQQHCINFVFSRYWFLFVLPAVPWVYTVKFGPHVYSSKSLSNPTTNW